jgi:integrase
MIKRELAALKRMFSLAIQARKLVTRPYTPMLRENNGRAGFFDREQFEAVRQHLRAALQPLVTVAYHTGWRIKSELLPLEWRQVDLKAGTIRLEPGTTKNRDGRLFVFASLPELCDTFKALAERQDTLRQKGMISPRVFVRIVRSKKHETERVVPVHSFRRAWSTACNAAGCPGRIPHDFRRTAVRNLERAGVARSTAMKMVGHKTESIYRRYAIVSETDLQEASAKLAELMVTKQLQSAASRTDRGSSAGIAQSA